MWFTLRCMLSVNFPPNKFHNTAVVRRARPRIAKEEQRLFNGRDFPTIRRRNLRKSSKDKRQFFDYLADNFLLRFKTGNDNGSRGSIPQRWRKHLFIRGSRHSARGSRLIFINVSPSFRGVFSKLLWGEGVGRLANAWRSTSLNIESFLIRVIPAKVHERTRRWERSWTKKERERERKKERKKERKGRKRQEE